MHSTTDESEKQTGESLIELGQQIKKLWIFWNFNHYTYGYFKLAESVMCARQFSIFFNTQNNGTQNFIFFLLYSGGSFLFIGPIITFFPLYMLSIAPRGNSEKNRNSWYYCTQRESCPWLRHK